MEAVTIRAKHLRLGDRPTEWHDSGFYFGPSEGPGEKITELYIPDVAEGGMVEAWTDTGVIAGLPAITCYPWQAVTVWREVGA